MRPIPTDDSVLLATPILYGFSLKDKMWCEFKLMYDKSSQLTRLP